MPTKDQIFEAIYEAYTERVGDEPVFPQNGWSTKKTPWRIYSTTQISQVVVELIKKYGEEWGPSGRTGSVQRDYTHDQTRRILIELSERSRRRTGRGSAFAQGGFKPSDFVVAYERLTKVS